MQSQPIPDQLISLHNDHTEQQGNEQKSQQAIEPSELSYHQIEEAHIEHPISLKLTTEKSYIVDPNTLLNLLWIVLHYVSYITDYLVLLTFWNNGNDYYFGFLAFFLMISWLYAGYRVVYRWNMHGILSKREVLILWLLHLDYPVLVFLSKKHLQTDSPIFLIRKSIMLVLQTIPATLITIHSIFAGGATDLIIQLSLGFSVFDFCMNNSWILLTFDLPENETTLNIKFPRKAIKSMLEWEVLSIVESASLLIAWGFFARLTSLWACWVFFPLNFLLLNICYYLLVSRKGKFFDMVTCVSVFCMLIGRLKMKNELSDKRIDKVSKALTISRLILVISFSVIFVINMNELSELIKQKRWKYFFYIGVSCSVTWIIYDLLSRFWEWAKKRSESNDYEYEGELRPPNILLNCLWVILHYASFVTDCQTLITFWTTNNHYYFGVLLAFLTLSWLLSGGMLLLFLSSNMLTSDYGPVPFKVMMLLWFFHLDYPVLTFIQPEDGDEPPISLYRKCIMLGLQSFPSIFITVHSIFAGGVTDLTPQLSIAFSILDISMNNSWILKTLESIHLYRTQTVKLSLKTIPSILGWGILFTVENISILIFWGFLALLVKPWGCWIYFLVNYIFLDICFYFCSAKKKSWSWRIWWEFIFLMSLGRLKPDNTFTDSPEANGLSKAITLSRMMMIGCFCIVFGTHWSEILQLIRIDMWKYYFWGGVCCALVWVSFDIIMRICGRKKNKKVNDNYRRIE